MSTSLENYIARVVAEAPPLSNSQKDSLALLLRGERVQAVSVPRAPAPRPPTKIYRHYDACGCLLYIGIAHDPVSRNYAHASNSWWMPWATRVELQEVSYPSRDDALAAEKEAIITERPVFNTVHAVDRNLSIVEYFIAHERWEYLSVPSAVDASELPQLVRSLHRAGLAREILWHRAAQR